MQNNEFKNCLKFGLWFLFAGLFFTIFDIYVLLAIATPNIMAALTPKEVYELYNLSFNVCFKIVPPVFDKILLFLGILAIIILLFCFRTINPYFNIKVFANWRSVLKIILAIIYYLILTSISILILVPDVFYKAMKANWLSIEEVMRIITDLGYIDFFLFIILLFGISWFIFHKEGYIGDFVNSNFKSLKDILKALKLFIWGAGLGFVIFILIYLGSIAIDSLISFYIQGVELNFDRFRVLSLLFILINLINWFLGSLIIYIFPKLKENAKEIMSSLIFFFIILSLSLFSGIYLHNIAKSKYDYGKSLSNILNISKEPSKIRTVLIFTKDKVLIEESPLLAREEYWDFRLPTIPEIFKKKGKYLDADLKNIKKVKEYLKRKNYRTNQLYNAYSYILQCYLMDWNIKEAMKVHYEIIQKTNNVLHCMIMLARLHFLQATDENLKWAEILSDEKNFFIGHRAAQSLGNIYWHYGKYDKAKYFYNNKALKEFLKNYYSETPNEFYKPKTKPVFTDGKVIGEIYINNKPIKGIKIGLANEKINIKEVAKASFLSLRRFAATTTTDKNGKFAFENIVDDMDYYLVIMANNSILPSNLNKLKFKNTPKKITINKKNPIVNLGRIDIVVQ